MGMLFLLVIMQLAIAFAGSWHLAHRGLGLALAPAFGLPIAALLLAIGLALATGGFSEGFARASVLFAIVLAGLLLVGFVSAAVAYLLRR
jgi:hypothetical protein